MRRALLGAVLAFGALAPARAEESPWTACARAIAAAEPSANLPPGLLSAIALVETGRRHPETGQRTPWPWSWNAGGEPGHAETREAAVAAVTALLASGKRSVDVGCMQVNLLHHPDAFPNVEAAFDPARNVAYAIAFLHRLRARSVNWAQAIADYHSGESGRGLAYHRRVVAAGRATGMEGGAIALPARATANLCAPGLRAVLVTDARRAARGTTRLLRPRLVCLRQRHTEVAMAAPVRAVRSTPALVNGRDAALLPLPSPPSRPAMARSPSRPRQPGRK